MRVDRRGGGRSRARSECAASRSPSTLERDGLRTHPLRGIVIKGAAAGGGPAGGARVALERLLDGKPHGRPRAGTRPARAVPARRTSSGSRGGGHSRGRRGAADARGGGRSRPSPLDSSAPRVRAHAPGSEPITQAGIVRLHARLAVHGCVGMDGVELTGAVNAYRGALGRLRRSPRRTRWSACAYPCRTGMGYRPDRVPGHGTAVRARICVCRAAPRSRTERPEDRASRRRPHCRRHGGVRRALCRGCKGMASGSGGDASSRPCHRDLVRRSPPRPPDPHRRRRARRRALSPPLSPGPGGAAREALVAASSASIIHALAMPSPGEQPQARSPPSSRCPRRTGMSHDPNSLEGVPVPTPAAAWPRTRPGVRPLRAGVPAREGGRLRPARPRRRQLDAVGAELVGLLLHARHGQLAGVVHGLREHVHLLVLVPVRLLEADVVDRAADDEAERVEAGLLDEQELAHGQVGREQAAPCSGRGGRGRPTGTPSSEFGS